MSAKENRHYRSFQEVTERLDQIVHDVRSKDTSLERSLDLFDEAIGLGSKAVELVDRTDFSPEEKERMADMSAKELAEAQQQQGGNVASALLSQEGEKAVADGEAMAVPGEPEGANAAQEALERALDDADDGRWSPEGGQEPGGRS